MNKPIDRHHVGKNNNIIEINGKAYDAKTGEILSHPSSTSSSVKPHIPKPKPTPTALKAATQKPTMHDVVRKPGKQVNHHPTKSSNTLMRHSVKKPAASLKRQVKAQGPSEVRADAALIRNTEVKPTKAHASSRRPKSPLIQHFAPIEPGSIQPAPVTTAPISTVALSAEAKPNKKSKPKTTSDLLEAALKQATSHEAEPLKKPSRSRRKRTTAALSVMGVMLLAFVGYQQIPSVKLELASARAGFSANLPSYKPAGYSFSKLNYSPGIVATTFKSNSDQRSYTLTQKTSDWNSQALKDNFVSPNYKNYETVQDGGRTIYMYGENNATWVNGGVWYIVQTNGALNHRQVVELAKSL